MGVSSLQMHKLGNEFVVVGGKGELFKMLDIIIKCEARAILRKFPALRDSSMLLEAISLAVTTNMNIVTLAWFVNFRSSKITTKKRATSGENRIWKYFERYQEILFNTFAFMFFFSSTALTLGALRNFHNIHLSDLQRSLWPKKVAKKRLSLFLFGIKGWFASVDDIPYLYLIYVYFEGLPLKSFLESTIHRDGSGNSFRKLWNLFEIASMFFVAILNTNASFWSVRKRIGHLLKNPLQICWAPSPDWKTKIDFHWLRRWTN